MGFPFSSHHRSMSTRSIDRCRPARSIDVDPTARRASSTSGARTGAMAGA
jgi:hypothetical protein